MKPKIIVRKADLTPIIKVIELFASNHMTEISTFEHTLDSKKSKIVKDVYNILDNINHYYESNTTSDKWLKTAVRSKRPKSQLVSVLILELDGLKNKVQMMSG